MLPECCGAGVSKLFCASHRALRSWGFLASGVCVPAPLREGIVCTSGVPSLAFLAQCMRCIAVEGVPMVSVVPVLSVLMPCCQTALRSVYA
eukprot:3463537-Alexandrium_andersonii.AAC.1